MALFVSVNVGTVPPAHVNVPPPPFTVTESQPSFESKSIWLLCCLNLTTILCPAVAFVNTIDVALAFIRIS